MFGTNVESAQKLASIEADLISAAAEGKAHLHSEVYKKFAALIHDQDDFDAITAAVLDEVEQLGQKTAAPMDSWQRAGLGLGLGAALAGPGLLLAKSLSSQSAASSGLANLKALHPEYFQQDPMRAEAIYKAVFSVAPSIATNTVIMGDLLRQMMSMPMLDLGTISKLVDMAKNKGDGGTFGTQMGSELLTSGKDMSKLMIGMGGEKKGSVMMPAKFKFAGKPCVLDWNTAIKKAGLTDAFTGSGTTMQQSNQATQMNDEQMGSSMMPLDAVVVELLQKEQELAQREQVLQQQEQQLQEAMKEMQGAGDKYQQETGVDPNTGDVVPEGGEGGAGAEGEQPGAEPGNGDMDGEAGQEGPPGAGEAPEAAEGAGGDPTGADAGGAAPGGDPADAGGEAGDGAAPPAGAGDDAAAGPPVAEGEEGAGGAEAAPPAGDDGGDGAQPAAGSEAGGGDGAPVAEGGEPPAEAGEGETDEKGEDGGEGEAPPQFQANNDGSPGGEISVPTEAPAEEAGEAPAQEAAEGGESAETPAEEAGEGEAPAAEGGEAPPAAEGEAPVMQDEGESDAQPGEGEEGAPPGTPAETEEGSELPVGEGEGVQAAGEDTPKDEGEAEDKAVPGNEDGEHDISAINEGEAAGPNTAESVDGTPEDEMHDAANKVEDGTPEDEIADHELAATLNAGGHEAGGGGEAMPAAEAAPVAAPAASPIGSSGPSADGGHEIVLPLRISIKIGERAKAYDAYHGAMKNLFTPSRA